MGACPSNRSAGCPATRSCSVEGGGWLSIGCCRLPGRASGGVESCGRLVWLCLHSTGSGSCSGAGGAVCSACAGRTPALEFGPVPAETAPPETPPVLKLGHVLAMAAVPETLPVLKLGPVLATAALPQCSCCAGKGLLLYCDEDILRTKPCRP